MTKEEFDKAVEAENNRHKKELALLVKNRVLSMARCKIGDIVEDKDGCRIIVKSIGNGSVSNLSPKPYYHGVLLTKKGEPRKDGMSFSIFDEHLVKVNGKALKE